ncbi:YaiI/YqxD family protein [Eubacteriales bacterium OttesenSCG-928-N13]|nr:YaiI/YqxD family protein [Eubacteriales bacterium OttesenSCG-928-N13]
MTIYIDADGCPVVNETIRIAVDHHLPCILLCDSAHIFEREGATTITVSKGADSVDFALVNLVQPGDIVITQDYGLAAMCLARRALPLHQNGMRYTADNIDALLLQRHTARKIRRAGGRMHGSKKRTPAEDAAFEQALIELTEAQ